MLYFCDWDQNKNTEFIIYAIISTNYEKCFNDIVAKTAVLHVWLLKYDKI